MELLEELEKIRRRFDGEEINLARKPIGVVYNAPLTSALGKE